MKGKIMITDKQLKAIKKELRRYAKYYDQEMAHIEADYIICKLLIDLGYEDVVKLYDKVPKWYA